MDALPGASGAEKENREPPAAESIIVVPAPSTEEQVITQVMTKARQNRSKSCHERSNSLKKYTKRKLAPDEDLITVVTDDHHFINSASSSGGITGQSADNVPKPKPRKNLSRTSRSGSASLGNILAVNPDQFLINDNGDVFVDKADRQTLPRFVYSSNRFVGMIVRKKIGCIK